MFLLKHNSTLYLLKKAGGFLETTQLFRFLYYSILYLGTKVLFSRWSFSVKRLVLTVMKKSNFFLSDSQNISTHLCNAYCKEDFGG